MIILRLARLCLVFSAITIFCMNTSYAANSTLDYKGRTYLLHKPPSVKAGRKIPLVVVLHGGLGNAQGIQQALAFDPVADKNGLMVAYVNGTGGYGTMADMRTWNAGNCCGIALNSQVDDVSFLNGFINEMIARKSADANRIYLVGHSNGAMMVYRFVCERPNIVAAMVSISGTITADTCTTVGKGLNALEVHGELDQNIPVQGGVGEDSITKISYRSVTETGTLLGNAGATFYNTIIAGGGHNIGELNLTLKQDYSSSLAEIVVQFIADKTLIK